jgi:exopolysaccharide production protein ExoQ
MPAWLIMDLVVILMIVKNSQKFITVSKDNLLLISWPLLAIVSSLWSLNPGVSFYHGIQFGLNLVCGFVIAVHLGLMRLVLILRLFSLVFTSISLFYDVLYPSLTRDIAGFFKGVYLHKNEVGMFSSLQLIVCVILFLQGSNRFLSIIGFTLACVTLFKSGSGTSLLVSFLIMISIPFLLALRRGTFPASQILGFFLTSVASLILLLTVERIDPVDYVLLALGKDAGLTGRDLIWSIGIDAVTNRPLLGHGFLAYWASQESTASYLRYVLKQDLVSLHNVYLEVSVAFGILGLVLFLASMIKLLFRTFLFFQNDKRIVSIIPLIYVLWIAIIGLSENPVFWNSQLNFLLMAFAALTVQHRDVDSGYLVRGRPGAVS